MKTVLATRNVDSGIARWCTLYVLASLQACASGEMEAPGPEEIQQVDTSAEVSQDTNFIEETDAANVDEQALLRDAFGNDTQAIPDAREPRDASDIGTPRDIARLRDSHTDSPIPPMDADRDDVNSREILQDSSGVVLSEVDGSDTTDIGKADGAQTEDSSVSVDTFEDIVVDANSGDTETDFPPTAEYLEALQHFPDLPKPEKGSTSWQPPASNKQPEICAQWAAQGWKALDVNPCDAPVATPKAQAELAVVPALCDSVPWQSLNSTLVVDIIDEVTIQELDYEYPLGRISLVRPTTVGSVVLLSSGPGNSLSPVKSVYMRLRDYDLSGFLVGEKTIADGEHYWSWGWQQKFLADGRIIYPARPPSNPTTGIAYGGFPSSLGDLKPTFVYEANYLQGGLPQAVAPIGPVGFVHDARETQDGFLLASAATSTEVKGNPCVDVALRRVTIDGGLQWTRYFHIFPAIKNGIGTVSTGAVSVRALPAGACGSVVAFYNEYDSEVFWNPGNPLGGFSSTSLTTIYYISEDGSVVHRADYALGRWPTGGYGSHVVSTDGEDMWFGSFIEALTLPVPKSTGKTTSVLRLGPDAKPKAFSVLSGIGGGGFPNAMLALPSKAVVMSVGADGAIVVLGPDLCPILKYDGFSDLVAGGVVEIVRVNDTLFAAHDKYRLYFFELPELFAWEQAQAQAAP